MKTRDTRAGARRTLRAQEGDAPPPVQEPNAPPPGSDDKAPVPGSDPRHEEMGDDPRDQPGRPSGAPPIDAPSYNPANDPGADPGQTEPGTVPDPKPKPPTEADTTLDPKGGAPGNPEDKPQVDAEAAASIAELCAAAGAPMLAAGFIRSRTSVADVRKRLDAAGAVRNLVAVARKASSAIGASVADEMIARGLTVDQAKAELFDKLHASVADISPIAPAPKEPGSDLLSKAAARINAQRTRTRLRQEVRH